MKIEGSLLGTLVFIWVVIAMVASYAYSCGSRRRGSVALLLGALATIALVGVGEEISLAMSKPPASKLVDIGILILFTFIVFDGIRGMRRNGIKPMALAAFILVVVVLVLACTGCAVVQKYEYAKAEYAKEQGLDREPFDLRPGGELEGGAFKYVSWQDGLAIFERNTSEGLDYECFDTHLSLTNRTVEYGGQTVRCSQSFTWFYTTVKFGNSYYSVYVDSIDKLGVAVIRVDYD